MSSTMPHHDDDTLSAILDGEAPTEDTDHLTGCEPCRARMEELRSASLLLAEAPAVDSEVRDHNVRAALERGAARLVPGGAASGAVAELASRRRRRQPPGWVVAAGTVAAAVVVFLGLVALGTGSDDVRTASDAPAGAIGPDAGFLGSFDNDEALRRELLSQLGLPASQEATPSASGSAGDGNLFAPGAGGGTAAERSTSGDAAPEPAAADEVPAGSGPEAGTLPRLTDEELAECADALDAEFPDRGDALLVARVVWQGDPAAVFVHRAGSGEEAFRAWLYAGDPCTFTTFMRF